MKKILALILASAMTLSTLMACGTESQNTTATTVAATAATVSEDTMGGKLINAFNAKITSTSDLSKLADELGKLTEIDCASMPVSEGYLNGFSGEVTGFKSGVMFSPYIGSIPMVGYIFETDDAAALEATLKDLADPRWNICTEAAETVTAVSGNYVFFAMCPGDEEFE